MTVGITVHLVGPGSESPTDERIVAHGISLLYRPTRMVRMAAMTAGGRGRDTFIVVLGRREG